MSRPRAGRVVPAVLAVLAVWTAAVPAAHARIAADEAQAPEGAAAGATPAEAGGAEPRTPDPNAEAQRLYDEGRVMFETADYDGAVERWTQAYAQVSDTPQSGRIKALLIYNIATGRERTFDVTRDIAQLRKAKILLEGFRDDIPGLYPEEERAAEQARVAARIDALAAQLDAAQGPVPQDPDPMQPGPTQPGNDSPSHAGRGLIIGGAVSLGLGLAGIGVMGAGLGMGARANDLDGVDPGDIEGRRDQFATGRTGNALAIAGGIGAGVFVATGAVLVALGVKKNRRVALRAGPGMVGVGVLLRL